MKRIATIFVAASLAMVQASQEFGAEPVFVESYEEAVAMEDAKVLIIFGAKWCKYCLILKEDLKSLNIDDYTVCIVDTETRKDLVKKYRVRALPTSVVIQGDKEISRKTGYEKEEYQAWLDSNRANKGK